MTIGEAAAFRDLKARVLELEKQVTDLKTIVAILTAKKEPLGLKKANG
jgi:hypothetical protein